MSSPRQIRFDDKAIAALKILQAGGASQSAVVSQALVFLAEKTLPVVPLKFNTLDTKALFTLQAELSQLERQYKNVKKDLLNVRATSKDCVSKLAAAVSKVDKHLEELRTQRIRISDQAKGTLSLTAENLPNLKSLHTWAKIRLDKAPPDQKPSYELELLILQSFFPISE